jgi:inosine/xanthosine triphosphatase
LSKKGLKMENKVIVAVGSANPVKIKAVEAVFTRLFDRVEVKGFDVPSGVADQPRSDSEAVVGAENRAVLALRQCDADFGVGLEGATLEMEWGMFLTGWIAVADHSGIVGRASGGRIPLPETIAEKIRMGMELGPLMDTVVKTSNTKQKGGAVGFFTNNFISRTQAFENNLYYALAPWFHKPLYETEVLKSQEKDN